jgi:plastocyanin
MTGRTYAVLALIAATLGACGGSGGYGGGGGPTSPPQGDGRTIAGTASLTFSPASLTVNTGDAVTFAFGSVAHNVFFDAQAGAPADIDGSNANVSIQRTFSTAGSFHYTCHIHPGMQGTVVVR